MRLKIELSKENFKVLYTREFSSSMNSNEVASVNVRLNEVKAISIWRTFNFDADTTYLFVNLKNGESYVFNTNLLRDEDYSEFSYQFKEIFNSPLEVLYSIPTVVYPGSAFGCPLFRNNWLFKLKWELSPNSSFSMSSSLSSCLKDFTE